MAVPDADAPARSRGATAREVARPPGMEPVATPVRPLHSAIAWNLLPTSGGRDERARGGFRSYRRCAAKDGTNARRAAVWRGAVKCGVHDASGIRQGFVGGSSARCVIIGRHETKRAALRR